MSGKIGVLINSGVGFMGYVEDSLSHGERIEFKFKLHWICWVPVGIFLLLGIFTLGLTWPLALYRALRIHFTELAVTNKRVILKTGIISRHTEEMKMLSIETVEIRQGILGRLLDYGTIKVTGRGSSDVLIETIAAPVHGKRMIENISHPLP